jgi:hypothetical protein
MQRDARAGGILFQHKYLTLHNRAGEKTSIQILACGTKIHVSKKWRFSAATPLQKGSGPLSGLIRCFRHNPIRAARSRVQIHNREHGKHYYQHAAINK